MGRCGQRAAVQSSLFDFGFYQSQCYCSGKSFHDSSGSVRQLTVKCLLQQQNRLVFGVFNQIWLHRYDGSDEQIFITPPPPLPPSEPTGGFWGGGGGAEEAGSNSDAAAERAKGVMGHFLCLNRPTNRVGVCYRWLSHDVQFVTWLERHGPTWLPEAARQRRSTCSTIRRFCPVVVETLSFIACARKIGLLIFSWYLCQTDVSLFFSYYILQLKFTLYILLLFILYDWDLYVLVAWFIFQQDDDTVSVSGVWNTQCADVHHVHELSLSPTALVAIIVAHTVFTVAACISETQKYHISVIDNSL